MLSSVAYLKRFLVAGFYSPSLAGFSIPVTGFTTVGQCEWADFPTKVLEKHWPDVPRWRDIRTLTGGDFFESTGLRTVTIISGGFPCQPFSNAGRRRSKDDDRYLWPEMLRVISALRPDWVLGENVDGIISLALDDVLTDLEGEGYETGAFVLPACGVGAPHRRYRVAIVAHRNGHGSDARRAEPAGQQGETGPADGGNDVADATGEQDWRVQQPGIQANAGTDCEHVANANRAGLQGRQRAGVRERASKQPAGAGGAYVADTEGAMHDGYRAEQGWTPDGLADGGGRATERGVGGPVDGFPGWLARPVDAWESDWDNVPRVTTGEPDRVNKLKALGNAVVPQQFFPVFAAIATIERAGGHAAKTETI
jgi:DNA (cytosine-5)-methyltransferase 1